MFIERVELGLQMCSVLRCLAEYTRPSEELKGLRFAVIGRRCFCAFVSAAPVEPTLHEQPMRSVAAIVARCPLSDAGGGIYFAYKSSKTIELCVHIDVEAC